MIGTHSGTFQCDEALGCWLLRQHPDFANAKIVRSRDNHVLDQLDIVIDVGGVYDPAKLRFDHHQRGAPDVHTAVAMMWHRPTLARHVVVSRWVSIDRARAAPVSAE